MKKVEDKEREAFRFFLGSEVDSFLIPEDIGAAYKEWVDDNSEIIIATEEFKKTQL